MTSVDELQELLKRLPGIGPRQARRFAYFLLSADAAYVTKLTATLSTLRSAKHTCSFCRRIYFEKSTNSLCPTCSDASREQSRVLVVEKNSDFENFEKTHVWNGRYFLIIKNIGLTEDKPDARLSLQTITSEIEAGKVTEVVTALSVNPDGEYTSEYIHKKLSAYTTSHNLKLSSLGRGLSTGSEIEYADSETLKQALDSRR